MESYSEGAGEGGRKNYYTNKIKKIKQRLNGVFCFLFFFQNSGKYKATCSGRKRVVTGREGMHGLRHVEKHLGEIQCARLMDGSAGFHICLHKLTESLRHVKAVFPFFSSQL